MSDSTTQAPPEREAASRIWPPLYVPLGAFLLYVLRFGYAFGESDQGELIPYLLHRLDATLFAEDWFVMTQASEFSIRTPVVLLLQSLAAWMPVWLAVLLVYVGTWLALAAAVYALAVLLTSNRLAAAGAVVAALVLTPQWTLGGNDLVTTMLVPSMMGWALGLWGLAYYLRARTVWAAMLLGLATWMQALVGLQLAGLLGLVLVWQVLRRETPIRPLLLFSGVFLVSALPALAPLLLQQFGAQPPADADLFYIMAEFRNPHHYLPLSYPLRSYIRFGLLALLGVLSVALLHERRLLAHTVFLRRLFVIIALLCAGAFLFTEVVPTLFIAKLQFFKTTVLAKLLFVILACRALVALIPPTFRSHLDHLVQPTRLGLGLTLSAWALIVGGLLMDWDVVVHKIRPLARMDTPVAAVEDWARTETFRSDVFLVPPSWSGFRSYAQRAVVIDFKAFPFQPDLVPVWYERLTDVAPIPRLERGTPALQAQLDALFLRLSPETVLSLADRYYARYVVRRRTAPLEHPSFELVFESGPWLVYRIRSDALEAA